MSVTGVMSSLFQDDVHVSCIGFSCLFQGDFSYRGNALVCYRVMAMSVTKIMSIFVTEVVSMSVIGVMSMTIFG